MAGRILIVDDDPGFGRALKRALGRDGGHDVTGGVSADEARALFTELEPDVVILDYQLPDADGLALLDELRPNGPGTVFLMATAYPDVDVAVEAMRRGAFDYVAKGSDITECLMRIERAVEVALLRRRMAEASRAERGGHDEDYGLTGNSPPMRALRERLDAVAASDDMTVFVLGETGTGKGVVARAIHAKSGRAYQPFVAVDCTTIPATLVESELFGHEKGAFSGASSTKVGRVEAAGQGTLFLDEIGELDLPVQAKLLRLLEEKEFTRVGSTKSRRLTARVITATNRDLEREVAEGRFRADLRYRLEVFLVESPPLRDRGDDLFLLTAQFAAERARALGRPEPRLSAKVIEWLPRYPFPGNIRELRNMVEQAVLLAKGNELTLDELPVLSRMAAGWEPPWPERQSFADSQGGHASGPPTQPTVAMAPAPDTPVATKPPAVPSDPGDGGAEDPAPSLEAIRRRAADQERQQLVAALEATGGNVAAAARRMGLSRYQALRRLKKHGLK